MRGVTASPLLNRRLRDSELVYTVDTKMHNAAMRECSGAIGKLIKITHTTHRNKESLGSTYAYYILRLCAATSDASCNG